MCVTIQMFTFVLEYILDVTGNAREDQVSCPWIPFVHLECLQIKPGSMKDNIMTMIF